MVPLVIPFVPMVMPMVPMALPLVSQWYHWLPMVPLVKLPMVIGRTPNGADVFQDYTATTCGDTDLLCSREDSHLLYTEIMFPFISFSNINYLLS